MIAAGLALFLAIASPSGGGPVLSEFMALNHATLDDEDGDSSDWIEVTNTDTQALDLDGWSLTDDRARPRRWTFPGPTVLQPASPMRARSPSPRIGEETWCGLSSEMTAVA